MPSPGQIAAASKKVVAAGDPQFANVSTLVHFDGANGSTTVTDVKGNTWTTNGGGSLSTSQKKFGTASWLNGVGDSWANGAVASAIGTGDFTVEIWVYPTAFASNEIMCILTPETVAFDFLLEADTGGTLRTSIRNAGTATNIDVTSAGGALVLNTWQHIAVSVAGTDMRTRVNGTVVNSGTLTGGRGNSLTTVRVGSLVFPGVPRKFSGFIDELRITKTVDRYPGSGVITPPSAAFPDF
jgi:concanavalin A-like lectin/glucanase superfamily protein